MCRLISSLARWESSRLTPFLQRLSHLCSHLVQMMRARSQEPTFSPQLTVVAYVPRRELTHKHSLQGPCTRSLSLVLKVSHPPTCPFHLPSPPHPSGLTSHFLRTACPATPNQVRFPGDRFYSSLYFTSKDWSLLLLKTGYLTQGHGYNKALKKYLLNKQTSVNLWSPPLNFTKKQALKN